MPSYLRNDIVLVKFPFSDLTSAKVRPATVVSAPHVSKDVLIVALTSQIDSRMAGEFILSDWRSSGLLFETAVKRAVFTAHEQMVLKRFVRMSPADASELDASLRFWMNLK